MSETVNLHELREEKKDTTTKIIVVASIIMGILVLVIVAVVLERRIAGPTSQITQVLIKVEYNGDWQGAYGDQTGIVSWNGHGSKTITLNRQSQGGSIWIISANAQKMDGSENLLKIMIMKTDGTILKKANTTAPYGMAQIAYSIQD